MQIALKGSVLRWMVAISLASILSAGCGSSLNTTSIPSGSSTNQATVPNVVGMTQAAAATAVSGAGLVVGAVTDQSNSTVASGNVISETPTAGTAVSSGSAVNLVVSSGPSQSGGSTPPPLSSSNLNLIFVVSDDLSYQSAGDVNPQTANLTSQGLNRSLLMGKYLQQSVLGGNNATGIYALEPASHLQTQGNFPDMAGLETVEQFALLNNITISSAAGGTNPLPGNSFPINVSYAPPPVGLPGGVATPLVFCQSCQGLDFSDQSGDNEALVNSVISANASGFFVFSAPWEVVSSVLDNINRSHSYNLNLPANYAGPNAIYAISIPPSGSASLSTFNSNLNPSSAYPTLPSPVNSGNQCSASSFSITIRGGVGGAVVPAGANTNETVYIIRHAEAHPESNWDDGNMVCAGQWRALALPNALSGKISPGVVYSLDPAQVISGSVDASGRSNWSYVRPALTVEPYAVANNLPYYLVDGLELDAEDPPQPATLVSNFFFTGGKFSSQKVLLSWEHGHIPTTLQALLSSYFPSGGAPTAPDWADGDYDSIWTVTLDGSGNLTVNNNLCEGIASANLPAACPAF